MAENSAFRDQLILDNMELVYFIARQLHGRMPSCDPDDLIQEGSLGLMAAAREYDPDRGASFRTYASFRIRGHIIDSLRAEWRHGAFEAMPEQIEASGPDLEEMAAASQLLERLPARERELVMQRYFSGETLREIGAVMSISAARVSQIRDRAIGRMRESAMKPPVKAAA